jgi:protein-S-isoprenylcysteine O-methyltransferase Ste14
MGSGLDSLFQGRHLRIPPAVWFFGLLGAGWGLERWRTLPLGWTSLAWQVATALALFGGASAFAAWAIVLFRAKRTTVLPFGTASALVTSGPFRLSRNPLYVSLVAVLAAFGLLLDSAWYLMMAVLLVVALDLFVIREEEGRLGELFGEEYARYSERVRRCL